MDIGGGNQKQMLNQDQDSNNENDNKSTKGENQDTEPNSKGGNANDSSNSEHSALYISICNHKYLYAIINIYTQS